MPHTIVQFIWQFSRAQQINIVLLTCATFPLLYFSLEIPKIIINQALSGTQSRHEFLGFILSPVAYLLTLSFILLALVISNGLFKMKLNTMKGRVGEELIWRMRYMLVERLLRFPSRKFEQLPQGEIIATVVQETDPLAGYSGESFALPLFQGGTLLTILAFMFAQNWVLGIASIALVPIQLLIIPRLQKQINVLRKQRVARARKLSSRLGETVAAADEIRIQGTRRYTLAEFSYRFGELYDIRLDLFKRKFFMKFLNNTLAQLTPFMFYAIGGYLVLQGSLTVGALVAAIAAHKDFLNPWKELLNFYQTYQDNKIRYQQIIRQFNPRNMQEIPTDSIPLKDEDFYTPLRLVNASSRNELQEYVFHSINLTINAGEKIIIVSDEIQLRKKFARVLAGLERPNNGHVLLGDVDLHEIDEQSLRLNMGYVNDNPYIFNAALSYNYIYSLNHRPPAIETEAQHKKMRKAAKVGNSTDWFDETFLSTWTSLDRFGAEYWSDMHDWVVEQMVIINADERLRKFSLLEVFNPLQFPEEVVDPIIDGLLQARYDIRNILQRPEIGNKIEYFDENQINHNSTFLENLIFGTFCDEKGEHAESLKSLITEKLNEKNILHKSLNLAESALRKLLRLKEDSPSYNKLTQQFELLDEEKRSALNTLVSHIENMPTEEYDDDCSAMLLDLFLKITPIDWKHITLDSDYVAKLLQVRKSIMPILVEQFEGHFYPFIDNKYNPGLTITNNILFGRIDEGYPEITDQIQAAVETVIDRQQLGTSLVDLFMINTEAGVNGSRIPEPVHHTLSLTRTLIKKPAILIMHDALAPRSLEEQASFIAAIQKSRPEMAMIWITSDLTHAHLFEKVYRLHRDSIKVENAA